MLFDLKHHIEVAAGTAVWPRLALAGNTEPRPRVHARRNAQLDGFLALHASLSTAFKAALLNDLARALAGRARARDGEESLRVSHLPASAAVRAGYNASSLLRPSAVAGLAEFLARQLDLGGHASRRFLEGQGHVVAQIGATLRSAASTASPGSAAKQIFESEEIPEDVVEVLKDGLVKPLSPANARKPGVAIRVIDLLFLRVAEHAVSFRAFAESCFCFRFVLRIAVGMPFQRGLAIRRLHFFQCRGPRNAQHFVKIAWIPFGHKKLSLSP